MFRGLKILVVILILSVGLLSFQISAHAQSPVVRAVLFYSPSCPHCQEVIDVFLPEWDREYGSQLLIFGVNTYTEEGSALYSDYVEANQIPKEKQGVPMLVVGDQYMVGSGEIPSRFPGIIEEGLQSGGIDWPNVPGLAEAMDTAENPDSSTTPIVTEGMNLKEKFTSDLAANILAVIVLAGMLGAVIYAGISLNKPLAKSGASTPIWIIPVLSLIGIGVAGYLAYVEFNQVEAVCGPVGNCNTVQQSSYATLFGVLPVGVLGMLGYIAIIITWLISLLDLPEFNRVSKLVLWLLTLLGTLFSIYLTFLEPFVIGASCIWCLSSAVIMTLLFLVATRQLSQTTQEIEE
jgi:uncharacterized membrane protein